MCDFNYSEYLKLINSEEYIKLHNYYTQETYWEITNTARQELPHSSFLRWLLDINGSHGLGDKPLRKFLEAIGIEWSEFRDKDLWFRKEQNVLNNKRYVGQLIHGSFSIIDEGKSENEYPLKNKRRADIFMQINIKFRAEKEAKELTICIENKVTSSENENQTKNYQNDLFPQYQLVLPVFLSPSKSTPDSQEFLPMDYQRILDCVLVPLTKELPDTSNISRFLKEYVRCLGPQSKAFLDEKGKEIKNAVTMAVTPLEKHCVKAILENPCYTKVLTAIMQSLPMQPEAFLLDVKLRPFWIEVANLYKYISLNSENMDQDLVEAIKNAPTSTRYRKEFSYNQKIYRSLLKGDKSLGALGYNLIADYVKSHNPMSADAVCKTLALPEYTFKLKSEADALDIHSEECFILREYYLKDYKTDCADKYEDFDKMVHRQKGYHLSPLFGSVCIGGKQYYVWRWWSEEEIEAMAKRIKPKDWSVK